jgi:hypothetical protein
MDDYIEPIRNELSAAGDDTRDAVLPWTLLAIAFWAGIDISSDIKELMSFITYSISRARYDFLGLVKLLKEEGGESRVEDFLDLVQEWRNYELHKAKSAAARLVNRAMAERRQNGDTNIPPDFFIPGNVLLQVAQKLMETGKYLIRNLDVRRDLRSEQLARDLTAQWREWGRELPETIGLQPDIGSRTASDSSPGASPAVTESVETTTGSDQAQADQSGPAETDDGPRTREASGSIRTPSIPRPPVRAVTQPPRAWGHTTGATLRRLPNARPESTAPDISPRSPVPPEPPATQRVPVTDDADVRAQGDPDGASLRPPGNVDPWEQPDPSSLHLIPEEQRNSDATDGQAPRTDLHEIDEALRDDILWRKSTRSENSNACVEVTIITTRETFSR